MLLGRQPQLVLLLLQLGGAFRHVSHLTFGGLFDSVHLGVDAGLPCLDQLIGHRDPDTQTHLGMFLSYQVKPQLGLSLQRGDVLPCLGACAHLFVQQALMLGEGLLEQCFLSPGRVRKDVFLPLQRLGIDLRGALGLGLGLLGGVRGQHAETLGLGEDRIPLLVQIIHRLADAFKRSFRARCECFGGIGAQWRLLLQDFSHASDLVHQIIYLFSGTLRFSQLLQLLVKYLDR